MSGREIVATEGLRIPITRVDYANNLKKPVDGVQYKITSKDPAVAKAELGAMNDGRPCVVLTPLTQAEAEVSFMVEDNLGSKPAMGTVAIVPSLSTISLGLAEAETFRQEAPPKDAPKASAPKVEARPAAPVVEKDPPLIGDTGTPVRNTA